jgi:DNA-binding HxlR family transcriptional regulator
MSNKSRSDLLLSLENHVIELNSVLGALSHQKRLQILLSLLPGDKSFRDLKNEIKLEKTALANHLNRLIAVQIISKPAYNTYHLSSDGERYLRLIESAYQQSSYKIKKDKEKVETRQFSRDFIDSFFGLDKEPIDNS